MPTREAIVDNIIPHNVEKPIPVRTISTRIVPREPIKDQANIVKVDDAAVSAAPAESVKLSPQLSAIARKEQAFRQKELALKQREKEFEAKLKDAETLQSLKTKLSAKDYAEAEALGLDYESYTKYKVDKLNGENPQETAIKKLEAEIEALKKGKEESAAQAYDDTVKEYKKEISLLTISNPEYASLKGEFEAHVLQNILDSWSEDGEEVTIEQAAKEVMSHLREEKKRLDLLFKEPEAPKVVAEEPQSLPPPRPGLKTLTQQITTGSETRTPKSLQFLSESERYAEARRRVQERLEKG
jgi:hypothetical protein